MAIVKFTRNLDIYDALQGADTEGCTVTTRSTFKRTVYANVQPKALSLRMSPMGIDTDDTHIGFCELGASINLNDYVCVYSEVEPDYQVSLIQVWRTHKSFELKRIV